MDGVTFSICFTCVSTVLYVLVIIVILKDSGSLQSSFYGLYIYSSITSLVSAWINLLFNRIPIQTQTNYVISFYIQLPFWIVTMTTWIWNHFSYIQYWCILFMALNRFTAIVFPVDHARIWPRRYLWIPLIFISLEPFWHTYRFFSARLKFIQASYGQVLLSDYTLIFITSNHRSVFISVLCLINIAISAASVIALCIRSKMTSGGHPEINLLVISICNCTTMMFFAILAVMQVFNRSIPYEYIQYALAWSPYMNDVFSLAEPYFMLIFNKRIRSNIAILLRIQKENQKTLLSTTKLSKNESPSRSALSSTTF